MMTSATGADTAAAPDGCDDVWQQVAAYLDDFLDGAPDGNGAAAAERIQRILTDPANRPAALRTLNADTLERERDNLAVHVLELRDDAINAEAAVARVAEMRNEWQAAGPTPARVSWTDLAEQLTTAIDSDRPMTAQPTNHDALADWLGERPYAYNITDPSDEQYTVLSVDVETLARDLIANKPALAQILAP